MGFHNLEERGLGVLLVEQHILAALTVADRGYVMAHGSVVAEVTAEELRSDVELLEASYLGEKTSVESAVAGGLV